MQPSLSHLCKSCATTTTVPFNASVFSQVHHCAHCGAASDGLNLDNTVDNGTKMATMVAVPNMQQEQDELAQLFSRINFTRPLTPPPEPHHAETKQEAYMFEKIHTPPPAPATHASQHYTPTRHMLPMRFTTPDEPTLESTTKSYDEDGLPIPPPPPVHYPSDEELIDMLDENGIDHTQLFPSQVNLFRNAQDDQRRRLLELWRISPPNCGRYQIPEEQSTWLETDVQKEEITASLRFDRMLQEQQQQLFSPLEADFQVESTMTESQQFIDTLSPVEDQPRPASAPVQPMVESRAMSCYEQLAQREYDLSYGQQQQDHQSYEGQIAQPQAYLQSPVLDERCASAPAYVQSLDPAWQKVETNLEMGYSYGNFEAMREADCYAQQGQSLMRNGLDEDMIM